MNTERCICGATDCPVCGPLQGYVSPPIAALWNQHVKTAKLIAATGQRTSE